MTKQGRNNQFGIIWRMRIFTAFVGLVLVINWILLPVKPIYSAGLDTITVALSNETINTASTVTVTIPFGTLTNGDTIKIYLGDATGGNEWQDNNITIDDIACTDDGTGESYAVNSVTEATASVPMWAQITATTVGTVPAATTVTCVFGDGDPNPINPTVAGNYSVSVITSNDSGAGIAYVGNANDVTVSAMVLPNLSLSLDNVTGGCSGSPVITCDLGVVTVAAVNTGGYDVNVGTNAADGASIFIAEDGDLDNGADKISDLVEDTGGTVTAGVDEYGISVVENGTAWTEFGDFGDDDTPITVGTDKVASTAAPIASTGDDVTILHRVAVSSTVKPLVYTHIVTWTATANF